MTETSSREEAYADEIDLNSIFAVLWKRKKLIICGTVVATLLSIGISLLLPRVYRSEGFFQLGNPTQNILESEKLTSKKAQPIQKKVTYIGMPVQFYKRNSPQFFNPNRFSQIANQYKSFDQKDLEEIQIRFKTTEYINKWIKPVYAFAKEDVREFAQLPQDESNSVIGLNLTYESDSPEKAYTYVSFFGNYIRNCLLYFTVQNYIAEEYSKTVSQMKKKENDIIDIKFELLQNTNKLKDIQSILAKYPESSKIESRQLVVSIQEGGDRFLTPLNQLVGIESALADMHQDLAALEREREKVVLRSEYFSNCYSELIKNEKHGDGEALFSLIKLIKDEVFKTKDLRKDSVKEVLNNLNIDLEMFDFNFFQNSRFISGPTVPTEPIKPRKTLIVILTFIGSSFFFIVLAFVLHWWDENKKAIMSTQYK